VFPERVKALKVRKEIPTCETVTVSQYWDPHTEMWYEFRDNEWITTNYEEQAMYFDFKSDQQHYINSLSEMFGDYDSEGNLPDYVEIKIRFRTYDISSPDMIYADDDLVLCVYSNGELPSSFCDYGLLEIDPNTAMRGERFYTVYDDGEINSQEIPMLTVIDGWNDVKSQEGCYEMLWMALEFEHPGGRWEELQWVMVSSEVPDDGETFSLLESDESMIYFERDFATGFSMLYVEVSAHDFVNNVQIAFNSNDDSVEIPLRIMYYDDVGTPIEALSSYFSVIVTYDGVKECQDVVLTRETQVAARHYIRFSEEEDMHDDTYDSYDYYDYYGDYET
jgi:hypothetical protein